MFINWTNSGVLHESGNRRINNGITRQVCRPRGRVCSNVATGLLKISPDFLTKTPKKTKTDKETKFKSQNTSTINA